MVTPRHDIIVYPCLDPQPGFESLLDSVSGEIAAMQRGRGHDFYRIRPYEASKARAMWIGKPPRIPASCKCASSRANRIGGW